MRKVPWLNMVLLQNFLGVEENESLLIYWIFSEKAVEVSSNTNSKALDNPTANKLQKGIA